MKITRFAHATMLIKVDNVRILIDPAQIGEPDWTGLTDLDAILITHEHFDHVDPNGIKKLIEKNPDLHIYSNDSTDKLLTEAGIEHTVVKAGTTFQINGVEVRTYGGTHAHIHPSLPPMGNIGVMIADRFYYPGDSYDKPDRHVEILALPTSGPWAKLEETTDYLIAVKPKITFPVHEALHAMPDAFHPRIEQFAKLHGIEFIDLKPGETRAFA